MSASNSNSTSPQYVDTISEPQCITSQDACSSNADATIASADLMTATASQQVPSSSNGDAALQNKTCWRCFGTGIILRNAGTGLTGVCPVCH